MSLIEFAASMSSIAIAIIAGIFASYRYLIQQMRVDRKFMEDRLTVVLSEYNQAQQYSSTALLTQTKALVELMTWLKKENGHKEGG